MAINVHVFSGGEYVDDDCINSMKEWSVPAATKLLTKIMGKDWAKSDCSDMFTDEDGNQPIQLSETVTIVSDNLITAVEDADEGGMLYIVRA